MLAACHADAPAPPASAASNLDAPPGPSARVDRERRLALLAPPAEGPPGPIDRQIANLQDIAKRQPARVDAWVGLGRAWARKARLASDPGFYRNADAAAQVALDLDPESALALDLRGLVLLSDHRFAEARDLAARVIAARPDDPMAYGTLSDAYLELGEFERAAEAAQKMVELKPNLPSYSRAAWLRWLQGDVKTAREIWRKAIDAAGGGSRDPEPRAWALVEAAMLFWHGGDVEGAEAGFDLALASFPDYPPALVGKGRAALARGDGGAAARLFDRAFAQSPLVETAWLLGDARTLAGDAKGAATSYAFVEQVGRRSDPRTLALYFATTGKNTDEALRLATIERERRGDVYTLDAYAWAAYRAGRLAEAREASDRATRLGTPDARLYYHAGAIRLAQGDAEGRKLIERALALHPKFDRAGAADAARLLARR